MCLVWIDENVVTNGDMTTADRMWARRALMFCKFLESSFGFFYTKNSTV